MAVINLVLAVGLSVDYAAHVGHSFMLKAGTRDERMVEVRFATAAWARLLALTEKVIAVGVAAE